MTAPAQPGQVTYQAQPPPEMTYEQYLAAVAAVTAALAATIIAISLPFQLMRLTRSDWLSFLAATYPHVDQARREIAVLSRRYYDSERNNHVDPVEMPVFDVLEDLIGPLGVPLQIDDRTDIRGTFYERLNINMASYSPDWYEEAMEAVVDLLLKPGTTDNDLARITAVPVKEAENGGRRTNIRAVETDPAVIGWARVQGGEDSCGFCAMLISRGPVFVDNPLHDRSAPTRAGLEVDDEALAVEIWRQAQATGDDSELNGLMNRWHPNCDCKVVPVFSRLDWQGRDQYLAMEDAWKKYAKGDTTQERFNAFRRYIEGGRRRRPILLPTAA